MACHMCFSPGMAPKMREGNVGDPTKTSKWTKPNIPGVCLRSSPAPHQNSSRSVETDTAQSCHQHRNIYKRKNLDVGSLSSWITKANGRDDLLNLACSRTFGCCCWLCHLCVPNNVTTKTNAKQLLGNVLASLL